ncbi:hypothetical protein GQ44DRAFT_120755 [Phaeosphaeriaceae sp. PMI808]|nr:hypothetical protein GQ44DRAFT_120755 [Phaeosphaeriaceae sp. PMI808]
MLRNARQNNSRAAQRDIVRDELMKILAPLCDFKTQGGELLRNVSCHDRDMITCTNKYSQAEPHNVRVEKHIAMLQDDRNVLPSIEEQTQNGHDDLHTKSPAQISSSSEPEEDSEVYEPPEILDHAKDGTISKNPASKRASDAEFERQRDIDASQKRRKMGSTIR